MSDTTNAIAQILSVVAFAGFGLSAIFSGRMVVEFERYGLARFRLLTGILQVAGSLGIIVGHFYRPILLISAGGLTAMMLLGVLTRIRIKDPLYAALPAFALMVLNLFIFAAAL